MTRPSPETGARADAVREDAVRPGARFAFLGPAGTFTEAALRQVPGVERGEAVPAGSVIAALAAVRSGEADHAMVPIENSVEGGVTATLDEIAVDESLQIVREVLVPISFVLLGREDMPLGRVRTVATHTHAWAQVRGWAAEHLPEAEYVPAPSTAAAARALLADGEPPTSGGDLDPRSDPEKEARAEAAPAFDAAVCAPLVAEQTGLPVLARAIEDTPGAVTRFVLVSRAGALPEPTGADKTTLTVPLPDDHPGALREILDQFATRGVNLSRIESRPVGSGLGRYFFSLDLEGHVAEERVGAALAALHRGFPGVRFLGSYPAAPAVAASRPAEAATAVERPARPAAEAASPTAGVARQHSDEAYRSGREWVRALRSR